MRETIDGGLLSRMLIHAAAAIRQQKQQINGLWERIFGALAEKCRDRGDVLLLEPGLTPVQARVLADRTAECCGGIAAVFSPGEEGAVYALVSRNKELGDLCKRMNAQLNGRGGGRGGFCQGSVKADQQQIREFFSDFYKAE